MAPLYGIDRGMYNTFIRIYFNNSLSAKTHTVVRFFFLRDSIEIHRKIQSKYSIELELEARGWIESVIGEPLPSDDFHESLKDGIILCK